MPTFCTVSGPACGNLDLALLSLEQRLQAWAADVGMFADVLQQAFGATANSTAAEALRECLLGEGLGLSLELAPLTGLRGAYAAATSSAGERILLNSDWLPTASADELEAVLLEELGHGIDQRLNGASDSPGDEGEIFSALLRGITPSDASFREDDRRWIEIGGQLRLVEAAWW